MDISVTPETEKLVQEHLKTGRYSTPSAVVADAVRLLTEHERKLEQLRKEIQLGIDQIERGEHTEYDEHTLKDLFDSIQSEGMRVLAARSKSGR
jgi:antitoxin ParD1/3/4